MRVMYLATYSPSAVKGLIDGSDRVAAGNKLFGSVSGKLVDVMFTRGAYDVVATVEVPDHQAAAATCGHGGAGQRRVHQSGHAGRTGHGRDSADGPGRAGGVRSGRLIRVVMFMHDQRDGRRPRH